MATYKLTYFNIMGLAEPIRYMLSYLGKEFEDVRIDYINDPERWPALKPSVPFGKLPVLETEELQIYQSKAICRYLAKESNLKGSNPLEDLEIDMIADTFADFFNHVVTYFWCKDEEYKEKLKDPLIKETIPLYIKRFDEIIKEKGYLANAKLSWIDLYVVSLLGYLKYTTGIDLAKEYPNIGVLQNKVNEIPAIKSWLKKRPASDW